MAQENIIHEHELPKWWTEMVANPPKKFGFQHDSRTCPCSMCKWADDVEKRHLAERKAEEERLQVVNAS